MSNQFELLATAIAGASLLTAATTIIHTKLVSALKEYSSLKAHGALVALFAGVVLSIPGAIIAAQVVDSPSFAWVVAAMIMQTAAIVGATTVAYDEGKRAEKSKGDTKVVKNLLKEIEQV